MEASITTLLLQFASFFAMGGNNAMSGVDLSSAYNGISDFSVVAVGALTFVSNWAASVWWTSAGHLMLLEIITPPAAASATRRQNRDGKGEERRKAAVQGIGEGEAWEVWRQHVGLLTVFTAASLVAVMIACTVLRTHLFIWTVFSPKYLYSMAWSLGMHLVRLWLALSPSYLHPDENFQGPEAIAGQIFSYPVRLTWEFTSENPIRSVFPLWPVHGLPMLLLRWLWVGNGNDGEVPPIAVFYTLRVLMFVLSFVLEDWAIHELVQSSRHRRVAVLLVASSYVTWTFQTHTFSNSVETLVVAWSLVLIGRILETRQGASVMASTMLGIVGVFGVFNRITFPAFLLIPGLRLIPHFINKPLSLISMAASALLTVLIAIALDTSFYASHSITWSDLIHHPVITPWNNVRYNISPSNLAAHGLHPWYQHLLVNIPLLIGPAAILLFTHCQRSLGLYSAISGIFVLSVFQHQEARFLQPTVPLLLSSIQLPKDRKRMNIWLGAWIAFNSILGLLMGIYHQGGVVPTQVFLSNQPDATRAVWWKTYMPPIWLLGGKSSVLRTEDVPGMQGPALLEHLGRIATCDIPADRRSLEYLKEPNGTYLIAPRSAVWLDPYLENKGLDGLRFREVWSYSRHLNMDDLDWGEDGVWDTLKRVIGRRGIVAWRVTRSCDRPLARQDHGGPTAKMGKLRKAQTFSWVYQRDGFESPQPGGDA
ncbi:hypothetical protein DL766_000487 [Monosporascus sp. MC13-8B]|nr:hypothetical protein DL766_000487 [Monosporascus sp. MC13-8B]